MSWIFNHIVISMMVLALATIACAVFSNVFEEKQNVEENLRVVQLLLFFVTVYMVIMIFGRLILISFPTYLQIMHLPASVQGALSNLIGKTVINNANTIMNQINALAISIVSLIINGIDLKVRLKKSN